MASLWQTLLKPDLEDDPDRALLANAANILEIGEFQLIQLAFDQWHRRPMTKQEQERVFDSYMLKGKVTVWMRSYAREIIELFENGDVDINDPKYHIYDPPPPALPSRPQLKLAGYLISVAAVFVILLVLAAKLTGSGGSVLPPYFDQH